jgi:hypothetical protein
LRLLVFLLGSTCASALEEDAPALEEDAPALEEEAPALEEEEGDFAEPPAATGDEVSCTT